MSPHKSRRPVLAVFEPPGYGGASTITYRLHRDFVERGYDSSLIILVEESHRDFYRLSLGESYANPDGLPGVFELTRHPRAPLTELLDRLDPDFLVGVGWIGALALKQAAPKRLCLLFSVGLAQAEPWLGGFADRQALSLTRQLEALAGLRLPTFGGEPRALQLCDYLLAPSPMVRDFYRRLFPGCAGKLDPEPLWVAPLCLSESQTHQELRRPFEERDVDVLFSASNWGRWEKGFDLMMDLLAQIPDCRAHVAGVVPPRQRAALGDRAVCHGLLSRREHYQLVGRSRCVAATSCFDAAPGLLFEAVQMGCNPVASRNCGNWQICPDGLVAASFDSEAFAGCIRRALPEPLAAPDRDFYRRDPVVELLEIGDALL